MHLSHMPYCCTMAVLGSFGEHGEPSVVTVAEIQRLTKMHLEVTDLAGKTQGGHKRCVLATSVDPKNIALLKQAGYQTLATYPGIQGEVHILAYFAEEQGSAPSA